MTVTDPRIEPRKGLRDSLVDAGNAIDDASAHLDELAAIGWADCKDMEFAEANDMRESFAKALRHLRDAQRILDLHLMRI